MARSSASANATLKPQKSFTKSASAMFGGTIFWRSVLSPARAFSATAITPAGGTFVMFPPLRSGTLAHRNPMAKIKDPEAILDQWAERDLAAAAARGQLKPT